MYQVYSIPRPPLGRLLLQCIWYGASRGATYGLICGGAYGALYFIVGAIIGGPIGFAYGAGVGAIDGLICGLILYRWSASFLGGLGDEVHTVRERWLKIGVAAFSIAFCLIASVVFEYGDTLLERIQLHGIRSVLDNNIMTIPSLIAGVCGYLATGRLLRWYMNRWVLQARPAPLKREYSGGRLV